MHPCRVSDSGFRILRLFGSVLFVGCFSALAADKPIYDNNFEQAEVGKVPDDFLVLDGGFVVKEAAGKVSGTT
jgi:hypothetical protein